jgi:transposase
MQGKMTSVGARIAVYAGIDVCKAWLDVYLHPIGQSFRVPNSREGCKRLALELSAAGAGLIVIEATGKLHRLAHCGLSAAGFAVAIVNPYRSRKLADALGRLAKTDRIDARILALYGEAIGPMRRLFLPRLWRSFRNSLRRGKRLKPARPL